MEKVRRITPEKPAVTPITITTEGATFQAYDGAGDVAQIDVSLLRLIEDGDTQGLQRFQMNSFLFSILHTMMEQATATTTLLQRLTDAVDSMGKLQNESVEAVKASALTPEQQMAQAQALMESHPLLKNIMGKLGTLDGT